MFDPLIQSNGSQGSLGTEYLAVPQLSRLTVHSTSPGLTPPEFWHHKRARLIPGPGTCPRPLCMLVLPVTSQPGMALGPPPANLNCAYPSQANSRFSLCHKTFLGRLSHTPFPFQNVWYFSVTLILGLCYTESNLGTQRKYAVDKQIISPKLPLIKKFNRLNLLYIYCIILFTCSGNIPYPRWYKREASAKFVRN